MPVSPHMNGVELIAVERERQVEVEGRTLKHDDRHHKDELARAATCYAMPEPIFVKREGKDGVTFRTPWPRAYHSSWSERGDGWYPWRKSETDRLTELVRAGALVAAEIDRLQRLAAKEGKPDA